MAVHFQNTLYAFLAVIQLTQIVLKYHHGTLFVVGGEVLLFVFYFVLLRFEMVGWDFVCPVGPVWINKPNLMVCWMTSSQDVVLLFHVTFSVIMYLLFTVELMALLQLDFHYGDVIMGTMASQITNLTIVYSTIYLGADQRQHQSSAVLAFVRGLHRGPVNSPHKWPVTRKIFPFDDVIMLPDKEITVQLVQLWEPQSMM